MESAVVTAMAIRLSVLDQSPISEGMTGADALRNSVDLARFTEELGYERYWVAEHHGTPMLACAAPEVLIAAIASATKRIRAGSGGVMLPYYSIFDNLSYRVDGNTVTLFGQVTRPTLKSDAENVVKRLEGVSRVINNIEVLPLSPMDNRIRIAAYRAIYGFPSLNRYAMGALPSIHIIVKNGNVTLAGVVANSMDRNLAFMRANGVSGAFSVTNELQTEK